MAEDLPLDVAPLGGNKAIEDRSSFEAPVAERDSAPGREALAE